MTRAHDRVATARKVRPDRDAARRRPSHPRAGLRGCRAVARRAVARRRQRPADADPEWSFYGADQGGSRYSSAAEITPANIGDLRRIWTYRTGDQLRRDPALMKRVKFQTTPILVDDRLVLCTPFSEVIALDPADGRELWRHDARVATDRRPANRYNCRGVAAWRDPVPAAARPPQRRRHGLRGAHLRRYRRCASAGARCPHRRPLQRLRQPGRGAARYRLACVAG